MNNPNAKVKNPIKQAAALSYTPESDGAPKITALGEGFLAEKIIETAQANEIPVYKDEKLVQALNYLKIGDEIPQELYEVVAEILVFLSSVDQKYGELANENR